MGLKLATKQSSIHAVPLVRNYAMLRTDGTLNVNDDFYKTLAPNGAIYISLNK